MVTLGDRIVTAVGSLRQRGLAVTERSHKGDTIYTLTTPKYQIVVTVNPSRWVGLHFTLGLHDRPELSYDIDTQLYDLASPRFETLARRVEDDVVDFLSALVNGAVKVGKVGRRPALLVTTGNRTIIVTKARSASSNKIRRASAGTEAKGGFTPLN